MNRSTEILNNFVRIYGERKFNKISTDIINSKHTKSLFGKSVKNGSIPTGTDFVTCVASNIKYSFSKGDTLLAASLVLLTEWIDLYDLFHDISLNNIKAIENDIIRKINDMSFSSSISIIKNIY